MVPYHRRAALKNLKQGAEKMEETMTPAARVRRQLQLGRPPKTQTLLHPRVAWAKSQLLLSEFRRMMAEIPGATPDDAGAVIVAVRESAPFVPVLVSATDEAAAMEVLRQDDVMALGMVFRQIDREAQHEVGEGKGRAFTFSMQFTGLSATGVLLMKAAVELVVRDAKIVGMNN